MEWNLRIAAIIAKSANAYMKKDLTPAATVKNWIIAYCSGYFKTVIDTPGNKEPLNAIRIANADLYVIFLIKACIRI